MQNWYFSHTAWCLLIVCSSAHIDDIGIEVNDYFMITS